MQLHWQFCSAQLYDCNAMRNVSQQLDVKRLLGSQTSRLSGLSDLYSAPATFICSTAEPFPFITFSAIMTNHADSGSLLGGSRLFAFKSLSTLDCLDFSSLAWDAGDRTLFLGLGFGLGLAFTTRFLVFAFGLALGFLTTAFAAGFLVEVVVVFLGVAALVRPV